MLWAEGARPAQPLLAIDTRVWTCRSKEEALRTDLQPECLAFGDRVLDSAVSHGNEASHGWSGAG